MSKDERIAALIASKKFGDADRKWLAEVPEDRLSAFEEPKPEPEKKPTTETPEPPKSPEVPAPKVETPVAAAKPRTIEEYIADAPAEMRDSLRAGHRAAQAHRAEVVGVIKASKANRFTDAQLNEKGIEELENIAALVSTEQDFSGRGMPRAAADKNDPYRNPPDPYAAALEARRASAR